MLTVCKNFLTGKLSEGERLSRVNLFADFLAGSIYDDENDLLPSAKPYSTDSTVLKNNHPLMIMVRYKQEDLLAHPLVTALLRFAHALLFFQCSLQCKRVLLRERKSHTARRVASADGGYSHPVPTGVPPSSPNGGGGVTPRQEEWGTPCHPSGGIPPSAGSG